MKVASGHERPAAVLAGSGPLDSGWIEERNLGTPKEGETGSGAGRPAHRQPLAVLVEDNQGDVLLITRAIEFHGVSLRLVVAEDGEKALQYFGRIESSPEADCPDLIILDLNLPRKSGAEVLESLRALSRCREIPVIVITSSDSREDRERAAALGAARYFRKPAEYGEFLKIGQILKECLAGAGK